MERTSGASTALSFAEASALSLRPRRSLRTVLDNITLFDPTIAPAEALRAAELACLDEDITQLPLGYSTPVGAAGGALSEWRCLQTTLPLRSR